MPCIINAESGTGLTNSADGSGLLKVQSGGKTTNALAWVNFNGTGTVAIRSSYNVSSITDNSVGDYTVNFATALSDANYSYSHAYSNEANVQHAIGFLATGTAISTGSLRVHHYSAASATNAADKSVVCIAIFGN